MNESQKALVKATVPILREQGIALTAHFYQRMLNGNPELKNIFNQAHQQSGRQQKALAGTVLAYAENIDNPTVLLPVVKRIAHKHTSLGIRAEQYAIVGKHLLASIKEILAQRATEELIGAWNAAYQQLVALFVGIESDLYQSTIESRQGWSGWRPFKIIRKQVESTEISSFYLSPCDDGPLPIFHPGQYISVRIFITESGLYQPRQYSLSQAPGEKTLRISVKREAGNGTSPQGVISNLLHTQYHEGDVVEVSSPYGDFFLNETSERPVVLLSGGVGITPMLSMSEYLYQQSTHRRVYFIHSSRNRAVHAFKGRTDQLASQGMSVYYYYSQEKPISSQDLNVSGGYIELSQVLPEDYRQCDYYVCGPIGFMHRYLGELNALGIEAEQIHAELFGSGGVQ